MAKTNRRKFFYTKDLAKPKGLFSIRALLAGVVELVDTLDLGSSAVRCESSSLSSRTISM